MSVTYDVVTRLVVVRRLRLSSHEGAASVTEPSLGGLVLLLGFDIDHTQFDTIPHTQHTGLLLS